MHLSEQQLSTKCLTEWDLILAWKTVDRFRHTLASAVTRDRIIAVCLAFFYASVFLLPFGHVKIAGDPYEQLITLASRMFMSQHKIPLLGQRYNCWWAEHHTQEHKVPTTSLGYREEAGKWAVTMGVCSNFLCYCWRLQLPLVHIPRSSPGPHACLLLTIVPKTGPIRSLKGRWGMLQSELCPF